MNQNLVWRYTEHADALNHYKELNAQGLSVTMALSFAVPGEWTVTVRQ